MSQPYDEINYDELTVGGIVTKREAKTKINLPIKSYLIIGLGLFALTLDVIGGIHYLQGNNNSYYEMAGAAAITLPLYFM